MTKQNKDAGSSAVYTNELDCCTVAPAVLWALRDEGKLVDLKDMHAPGSEVSSAPWEDEAVVFAAFLDAGLCLSCVDSLFQVLQLYRVDLAQLTPNSIAKLGVFEWVLRTSGASNGEPWMFMFLHDGRCQPKKKDNGETL